MTRVQAAHVLAKEPARLFVQLRRHEPLQALLRRLLYRCLHALVLILRHAAVATREEVSRRTVKHTSLLQDPTACQRS